MDPTIVCCPNPACPARGHTGQGNLGIHSRKDKRFVCAECHKGSEDAGHGRRDHASLLDSPGAVVVSCAAVSLDATHERGRPARALKRLVERWCS